MISRIDALMEDYRRESEEKNRQKLRVLSAQLTPHFIYNALNTIKWVAVLNHQENIQKLKENSTLIEKQIQLEELGMKVTRANDGKQAVELFSDNPADTAHVR